MKSMKCTFRNFLLSIITAILVLTCLQVILELCYTSNEVPMEGGYRTHAYSLKDVTVPVILWWTHFTGEDGSLKTCDDAECFFTENRVFLHHPLLKVVMFYGSKFDLLDLPLPRNGCTIDWALFHEESPKNTPVLSDAEALKLFNYTATFSRQSNFPLTLQYLENLEVLTGLKYFIPLKVKNEMLHKISPVLYIHSDCNTPLERDMYVKELMKYIPIDSYGTCLQNKELPPNLRDPMESMDSEEFFHFVAQYKFTLAFENAVCEDYITEKLWRPLIVGSIPIYMGSPSVRDWLPNPNSAIIASDFNSPKELAQFLLKLNNDSNIYESYLEHKMEKKIMNDLLISTISGRSWGIGNDFGKGNMVEHFECFVCKKIHKKLQNVNVEERFVANSSHYDCPQPVSPLTHKLNHHNWWLDQWQTGHCEAQTLIKFLKMGNNKYTHDEFYKEVKRLLLNNLC